MNNSTILEALVSHAMTLGVFDRVNKHEPKNAPGRGFTCAFWLGNIDPLPGASGLVATTVRVMWQARVYTNMLAEPQDGIDPDMLNAVDALMNAYSGDFTLGGLIRNVDLLGEFGEALRAMPGYLDQDNRKFRVATIMIPLIINDAWGQS